MSRGPGRWQRLILEAVGDGRGIVPTEYVYHRLGRPLTSSEHSALIRAAHQLAAAGRIRIARPGTWLVAIPPGIERPMVERHADGTLTVKESAVPRDMSTLTCARCGAIGAAGMGRGRFHLCHGCVVSLGDGAPWAPEAVA